MDQSCGAARPITDILWAGGVTNPVTNRADLLPDLPQTPGEEEATP